jgi:LmbE family N-acetylglucosaminyl deacetylase
MEIMTRKFGFFKRLPELLRRRSGPYHFLIHGWKGISDLDLAIGLLDSQFFNTELDPQPLPVDDLRSILVLAPHQDDETIGAGGTLLLAKKASVELHVLFVMDGRPSKEISYGGRTPEEVIRIRNREAEQVCSILGAHIDHLSINNAKPLPSVEDLNRLYRKIERLAPQVILVPWLIDTPKHRMVNHLLWLTDRCHPLPNCEVWGYQVHNSPLLNGYVDITAVAQEKRKLLELYTSQLTYQRRYDHMAMGMAAWNSRYVSSYKGDPVARFVEVFCVLPLSEHLKLIELFYLPDLNATYRGNRKAEGMYQLHRIVMNMRR